MALPLLYKWENKQTAYMDIRKCLIIDDWVSFVNSLHIEMEAFDRKAVVDT